MSPDTDRQRELDTIQQMVDARRSKIRELEQQIREMEARYILVASGDPCRQLGGCVD